MTETYATLLYGNKTAAMKTMLYSLRRFDKKRTVVIMTLEDNVAFAKFDRFAPLEEMRVSRLQGTCNVDKFARARHISQNNALSVFSTFQAYNLTKYSRILWLESDQLVMQSLEPLWRLPLTTRHTAAAASVLTQSCTAEYVDTDKNFSFARARKYNTGVVLFRPSISQFEALITAMRKTRYTCTDGSQTLWNQIMARHTVCIHHSYNCIEHSGPEYPKRCLSRNNSTPHIIHFAGSSKPWIRSSKKAAIGIGASAWHTTARLA